MIDLTSYTKVQSNLFVRIQIDEYRTTSGGSYSNEVLKISDLSYEFEVEGEAYTGLGKLLGVTSTNSEIRVSGNEVTITLSGIPNSSIAEIVNSKIKGSSVKIYRVLFDGSTGAYLNITGNPIGRFNGYVNNYSLQEDYDIDTRTSTNTLVLTCSSIVDVLGNKITGRKTNPSSMKKFYPSDVSMDRVPSIENTTFNFGAK